MSAEVSALVRRLRNLGYSEEKISHTLRLSPWDVFAELADGR